MQLETGHALAFATCSPLCPKGHTSLSMPAKAHADALHDESHLSFPTGMNFLTLAPFWCFKVGYSCAFFLRSECEIVLSLSMAGMPSLS